MTRLQAFNRWFREEVYAGHLHEDDRAIARRAFYAGLDARAAIAKAKGEA
jgi:hypothetical protein